MIKDELKMRVAKIYEKVDDARAELNEQNEAIKYLIYKIVDLAAEVDSLQEDLEFEDE